MSYYVLNYKVNIGDLNKRITIQNFTTIINDSGFEVNSWEPFKTVWASANNLSGREYFAAQAVQAENTLKFLIRYTKGISTDMRILFEEKFYNITFIDDVKYSKKFIEIKALEEVF